MKSSHMKVDIAEVIAARFLKASANERAEILSALSDLRKELAKLGKKHPPPKPLEIPWPREAAIARVR